jgi:DNA-binding transcriptional MerR regulator
MSRFLIGQVCNALGVRAHVLRYWERHVGLLSPAKDRAGRRVYTLRDVQLLFRLKYLVQTRKMSVEGASRKLVEEVQGEGQNRKAALDSLRGDLFRVHLGAQRLGEHLRGAGRTAEAATPHHGASGELISLLQRALRSAEAAEPSRQPAGNPVRSSRGAEGATPHDRAAARAVLEQATLLVVTPTPEHGENPGTYPGLLPLLGRGGETVLDRIGGELSALADGVGVSPHWLIGATAPVAPLAEAHVRRRGSYGLPPERVEVYVEPEVPYLDAEGSVIPIDGETAPRYRLPLFSALAAARSVAAGAGAAPRLCLLVPITNAVPRVPDIELVAAHLGANARVSVKAMAVEADTPLIPTGEVLIDTDALDVLLESVRPAREVPPVRRSASKDDILVSSGVGARLDVGLLLEAVGGGLIFEVDPRLEVAFLRSPADWDTCSARVRERSGR